jgi:hypothetical protein
MIPFLLSLTRSDAEVQTDMQLPSPGRPPAPKQSRANFYANFYASSSLLQPQSLPPSLLWPRSSSSSSLRASASLKSSASLKACSSLIASSSLIESTSLGVRVLSLRVLRVLSLKVLSRAFPDPNSPASESSGPESSETEFSASESSSRASSGQESSPSPSESSSHGAFCHGSFCHGSSHPKSWGGAALGCPSARLESWGSTAAQDAGTGLRCLSTSCSGAVV